MGGGVRREREERAFTVFPNGWFERNDVVEGFKLIKEGELPKNDF